MAAALFGFLPKISFSRKERKSLYPESLSTDYVKAFLFFWAVTKKVPASAQNQAFNALLFFHQQVLKQEFGMVEGVVALKEARSPLDFKHWPWRSSV
jgi:hypothetical protein